MMIIEESVLEVINIVFVDISDHLNFFDQSTVMFTGISLALKLQTAH